MGSSQPIRLPSSRVVIPQGYPSNSLEVQHVGMRRRQRHGRTVLTTGCLHPLSCAFFIATTVITADYLAALIQW